MALWSEIRRQRNAIQFGMGYRWNSFQRLTQDGNAWWIHVCSIDWLNLTFVANSWACYQRNMWQPLAAVTVRLWFWQISVWLNFQGHRVLTACSWWINMYEIGFPKLHISQVAWAVFVQTYVNSICRRLEVATDFILAPRPISEWSFFFFRIHFCAGRSDWCLAVRIVQTLCWRFA